MGDPRSCILHVDRDDGAAADVEQALVRAAGRFETLRARSYEEAVTLLDAGGIDCVVSERSIGSGTGLDLLATVRERDSNLPFVLFTANGDETFAAEAIGAGVTDYFRKDDPDALELLGPRIRRAVAGHRAELAARERTRELSTLHAVSAALTVDAPLDDRLRRVVEALPTGFQRPDRTAASLAVEGVRYDTVDYASTDRSTSAEATFGETTVTATVVDLDDAPGSTTDPFIEEERELLGSVAEMVAVHVDRAETVERLKTFAHRLETILQHTTNLVFMKDPEGRYVLVNEAFESFVGLDREAILGRTAAEIHDGATFDWIDEHDAEVLETGELRRFEERYPRPDGERRFVTVRVPLFDADGEPYAVYGIATDITEETRLAEERVELLDRMTDGFLALDHEGRVTYCNSRAAALVDRDPDALVGVDVRREFPELDGSAFGDALEEATETGESASVTSRADPLDTWFNVRIYPSESGVSIYLSDVTESVAERHEIERREETMRRLYETIADKEATFEEKTEWLLELGKEVLGVESGLLSRVDGDDYHAVVAADDTGVFTEGDVVPLDATNCERVVSTERSLRVHDVGSDPELAERAGFTEMGISCYVGAPVVVEGDVYGTFCFYDGRSRPEPFPEWAVTLVDLMARWVSYDLERQRTESEVTRERDRLETFASMVSHDLRNPLNVATGHVDLAREAHDGDSLETAARALDRMGELIEDALSFARLGAKVVEVEEVDLDAIAREAWNTVDTADATLALNDPGVVAGDASRVRTLLENLFRNAVEHGGSDVTVTVGRSEHGFYVADDGPGIPESDRERVFELGYTTSKTGTGFGLGIVTQIAEAHGWTVRVVEGDAGGARFEFGGVSHVLALTTRG